MALSCLLEEDRDALSVLGHFAYGYTDRDIQKSTAIPVMVRKNLKNLVPIIFFDMSIDLCNHNFFGYLCKMRCSN